MPVKTIIKGTVTEAKIWTPLEGIESSALDQIKKIASLPWVYKHAAIMADCHWGNGFTVGSVVAMKDGVAPAAVGVDIGCGVGSIKTNLKASDLPDNLNALRLEIESLIPVGFNSHEDPLPIVKKSKLFGDFRNLHEKVQDNLGRAKCQVGTLGGGNHFIELCLDTEQNVWMMLHSGSRNIGKCVAEVHIAIAKTLEQNKYIGDRDLSVFLAGTPEMSSYRHDLFWCQEYAFLNRVAMFELYKKALLKFFPKIEFGKPILAHHNYVAEEIHYGEKVYVTRKGAISAQKGEFGIIPGSMGTKSYIVKGLGNPESFCSASHGAGRRMSRGAAKKAFTLEDLAQQTAGVECRKDFSVIDEIPGAYKDIDTVMANQNDLVEIVAELKQVLCVKGA